MVFSCAKEKAKEKEVVLEFHIHEKVRRDTFFIEKKENSESIELLFKLRNREDEYVELPNRFYKHTDEFIGLDSMKIPLKKSKTFRVNGKNYEVKKYIYDLENAYDEETAFFVVDQYGILVVYDLGWHNLAVTIPYDSTSQALINSIINDSTRFMQSYN